MIHLVTIPVTFLMILCLVHYAVHLRMAVTILSMILWNRDQDLLVLGYSKRDGVRFFKSAFFWHSGSVFCIYAFGYLLGEKLEMSLVSLVFLPWGVSVLWFAGLALVSSLRQRKSQD